MLDKKTILVGYSGHGLVVAEAANLLGATIIGYTELKEVLQNPFNLNYLGFEMDPNFEYWRENKNFILGIGDNTLRRKIGEFILRKKEVLLNTVHPSSSVTKMLKMGVGNFIARNACINPLVEIGDFCIINTGAVVEHECTIKDAVHIGPGAVLAGNVEVGDNTFIGANTVVKQGVKIGKNVIIGAGSVIIRNIDDNSKVVGNPGRFI